MATTAQINNRMLTWSRERSGTSVAEFAAKCGISAERLYLWEAGKQALTFNQAQKFADKAHVPFGYLFLSQPPIDVLPIPDLRTVGNRGVNRPSAELLDLLKLTLQRQQWYREYLTNELAGPCVAVGRVRPQAAVQDIVIDMRQLLDVPAHPERGTWDDYYRDLVVRIEAVGVLVMRESSLGHPTRPLLVEEFRGFAIADEFAPTIFVNHADSPGARLFTLIHELCHIWMGISGISDGSESSDHESEVKCNAVAAEFLVPEAEFQPLWNDLDDWRDNLAPLETHFHVSQWVLARRALTLGLIDIDQYRQFISEQKTLWDAREKKGNGGPNYHRTKNAQISKRFSKAVLSQAFNGQILLREAGQLLGINPAKLKKFADEVRL
ncbi:helix-turn-helix domain-containing protein [Nitrincola sp. MINF-07-Sa-05]|uniref:helix-turn-helix domain-containing protein n=1 Tax=Nitrincola salilacus TaxID=3400273 RepID=UPI003918039C